MDVMKTLTRFTILCFGLLFLAPNGNAHEALGSNHESTFASTADKEMSTTTSLSCLTPAWLWTSDITSTSATLTWTEVWDAQSYSVQIRMLPYGSWYEVSGSPFTNTWTSVYNLSPSTTYEWRVRSNCGYGQYSPWSVIAGFTTLGMTCQSPTGLYTLDITQTSAKLKWNTVWGAQNYTVQIRMLPYGYWYEVSGSPFTGTWTNVYNLSPATTYEWRVRANCGYGQYSPWSYTSVFTTLGMTCEAPTGLYTLDITQTSAKLKWNAVWGAQHYTVEIRMLPYGYWYEVSGSPFTGTWTNVYNLSPSTTYEWRVRAKCGYGKYSPWSYTSVFTTQGMTCQAPTGLYTLDITQTSAKLKWN
jgi:hypothetical protein